MSTTTATIPFQPIQTNIATTKYNLKFEENDNILLNRLLFPDSIDSGNSDTTTDQQQQQTTDEVTNHFRDLLHRIKDKNGGRIIPKICTWDDAISKLQKNGWTNLSITNYTTNCTTGTTTTNENEKVIPAEVINTITCLLGISSDQAERISNFTLSGITSSILDGNNNNIKEVTSSPSFLQRVSEFYFQQCLADVRIIVGSLIIVTEENEEHLYREACLEFLKELDGGYVVTSGGEEQRGLFRLLMDIAFSDSKVGTDMKKENDSLKDEGFMESWKESYESFLQYCQKEAMDGLLLLCYQYMNVTRNDLALFLTCWEMRLEDDIPWKEASWIGAELFSLWKCSLKKEKHSLLDGENVVREWDILLEIVSRLFHNQQEIASSSPDSLLVIFCMGLFLLTYHKSFPENTSHMQSMAMECINTSNQHGVFDVLHSSLQSMSNTKQVVLYHTIAREMFLVMIHTLQNTCSKGEYIILFSKIGMMVYDNLEALCVPFWSEWEEYATSFGEGGDFEERSMERGVCKLMHLCQSQALTVTHSITPNSKNILQKSLPYIQLLCALVHDENTVQYVYGNLLPCAFLKAVLNGCTTGTKEEVHVIIKSLVALLQNGGTIGRTIFRQILQLDGLQQIHRTLFTNSNQTEEVLSIALQFYNVMILDSKLVGQECEFAYAIALYIQRDLHMNQVCTPTIIHSFLDLIGSLISNIPSFLSSEKQFNYLQLILDYVRMCCVYFTSSHLDWNTTSVSLKVLGMILEFLDYVTLFLELSNEEELSSIRDELILRILPSKGVACKLATLATVPITKAMQDHWNLFLDFSSSTSKTNEKKNNSSWFQNINPPSSTMTTSDYITKVLQELHLVSLPNMLDEDHDVSSKAIQLLRYWTSCASQSSSIMEDMVVSPIKLIMSTVSTPLFQEGPSNKNENWNNNTSSYSSFCITYLDLLLRYVMMDETERASGTFSFSSITEDVLDILSNCIHHSTMSFILPIIQDKNLYTCMVQPILSSHHSTSLQMKVLSLLEKAARTSLEVFHYFIEKDKMDVLFNFWKDSMKEYQTRNDWDSLMICSASSSLISTLVKQSSQTDRCLFYSMDNQSKLQGVWSIITNVLSHSLHQVQSFSTSTKSIEKEFISILHFCSNLIQYLSNDIWNQVKNNKTSLENFREIVEDVMLLPWDSLLHKDLFTLSFQSGFQQVLEQDSWMNSFCWDCIQRRFHTKEEEYDFRSSFFPPPLVSFLSQLEGGKKISSSLSSFLHGMDLLSTQSSLMRSFGQFIQLSLAVTHRDKGNVLSLQSSRRRQDEQSMTSPEVNRVLLTYTNWTRPLFQTIVLVLMDYTSTYPLIWNRRPDGDDASCVQNSVFLQFYRMFGKVVLVFVQSLLSLSHYANEDEDNLEDMFELLYQGSSRLFSLVDPPSSMVLSSVAEAEGQSFYKSVVEIGCLVKQNILSCAMILVKQYVMSSTSVQSTPTPVSISNTPERSHFRDKKSLVEPRVGFIHLICDTLRLLRYRSDTKDDTKSEQLMYEYNFESTSSYEWNLYLSCLYLLDNLISLKTISPKSSKFFCRTLCEVIQNGDLFPLLLQHFQIACRVAADTYSSSETDKNTKIRYRKHEHSVFVAQRIMDVMHHIMGVVLSSNYVPCYSKLVRMILKDEKFFYSLIENPLFRLASNLWSSSSNGNKTASFNRNVRGYLVLGGSEIDRMNLVGRRRPQAQVDPVHLLWRTTLSTLSGLLRLSSLTSNSGGVDQDDWITCFQYVIDFLSSYELVITSAVMDPTADSQKGIRNMSNLLPPSSQLFTVNYLQELCDTLSFLSELFSETRYRNLLASTHPSFYNSFLSNLLEITRRLSTFIGSAAIARRLFSMLNHKKRRTSFDSPGMLSRHYSTSLRDKSNSSFPSSPHPSSSSPFVHGAGGGTVPNARHEAISYAHYASSCCVVMTAEDISDYSSVTSEQNVNTVPLEQSAGTLDEFQIYVNNKFTHRTELYASECLFHALGILSNTHPAWVGFVPFQPHESKKLFTSSSMHEAVKVGGIIALRPPLGSSKLASIKETEELRYATIVSTHTHNATTTWDVEYFPSFVSSPNGNEAASERFVSTSRFAGMVDKCKWKTLLAYDVPVIPKSVSELAGLDIMSIAHIIFIFQWCQEQMGNDNGIVNTSSARFSHIKLLAERASIFLSMDMLCSNRQEQQISSNVDLDARIRKMAQLLDLFLDDDHSNSTDVSRTATPTTPGDYSFDGSTSGRRSSPGNMQHQYDNSKLRNLLDHHVWETAVSILKKQIDMDRRRIGSGGDTKQTILPTDDSTTRSLFS